MRDICRKMQEYGLELIVERPEGADSQIEQAALEAFLEGKKEKGEKYEWTVPDLIENYNFLDF